MLAHWVGHTGVTAGGHLGGIEDIDPTSVAKAAMFEWAAWRPRAPESPESQRNLQYG